MKKTIFKGKVVTLNIETVMLPNGVTVDLEVVRHPGAAAIVPMKDDRTVILVRQYRHAAGGYIFEIPAGKLNPGEDPHDCAERELEEEIGYRPTQLQPIASFFSGPGFTDEVLYLFKASGLVRGTQALGHDEVLEVVEISLEEAIAKVQDGTIRDAKTIIGLQAVYLGEYCPKAVRLP